MLSFIFQCTTSRRYVFRIEGYDLRFLWKRKCTRLSFILTFTIITHQEVASDSFCFLINSSWLLVFILYVFSLFSSGFNLYWWKGIHFSQNLDLIFLHLFFGFIINFWYRDLLREFYKKYEVLLIMLFLLFLLFLVSEGLLFVSFFWTSFHSLSSPSFGDFWTGFYVPDPCELSFGLLNPWKDNTFSVHQPGLSILRFLCYQEDSLYIISHKPVHIYDFLVENKREIICNHEK